MEFIIVTGFSGAGKSRAIEALEDIGYYCVDNIPPKLIKKFTEICLSADRLDKVAVVTDARGGGLFRGFSAALEELQAAGCPYKILFLEASDEVLVNRYKETRRKHPLAEEASGSVERAVEMERELFQPIRVRADYILDTSLLSPAQLKKRICDLFLDNPDDKMRIQCMSFGFKYGPATEADLVFDVRCLPNPFYIDCLKHKTGLDTPVQDYVMESEKARALLEKLYDMIDFLIPLYRDEGKSQLVIAFGCTGGKHRSVTFAELLFKHLTQTGGNVRVLHRDIEKL